MRFDELFVREQQIRRTSFAVRIIILALAITCIITFSIAGSAEDIASRVALAWITFGSQIIFSSFNFIGIVIGETTPRLWLWHNVLSGCLFFSSGVCCMISYSEASSKTLGDVDALLATGVFAILVSMLHVLEIVFARRLRNLVPSTSASTFSFH